MPNQGNPTPGPHTAPPTPVPSGNPMTAPSPSALLNNGPSGMNPSQPGPPSQDFPFSNDLISTSLEDFSSFGGPDNMDFDRAFGEWFTEPSLDLK